MARYRTHKHYCANTDCKAVIATCSAPQDYDGSPNCCEDEAHFDGVLCDDCWEAQREADEAEAARVQAVVDAQIAHLLDAVRVASVARTPAKDEAADANVLAALHTVFEVLEW